MHTLILGMTRMGKTTWAVALAREFKRLRKPVVVLTVKGAGGIVDPRWSFADLVTADREKFLKVIRSPKTFGVMVFVDEANQTVGWHDLEMEATATAGSLNGLTCHYISQRAATFNRSVREQCSRLVMFRQGPEDCETMARQFGQPELREGWKLGKGEYFYCTTERGSFRRGVVKLGRPMQASTVQGFVTKKGSAAPPTIQEQRWRSTSEI